jgi:hypothetical protein
MFSINFSFEEAVKLLADSSNFYLVKIDNQGLYVYMNQHFIQQHSTFYNGTDIRSAAIALHPDDHDLSYATFLKCMAQPTHTFPATLRKLDGKGGYIITYWEYKANILANGSTEGVIGVGYDITAFESRREHIRFLTDTLNHLARQQSHGVRRPLANIGGLVEVLKLMGEDNPDILAVTDKLSQSCDELNNEFELFMIKNLSENSSPE